MQPPTFEVFGSSYTAKYPTIKADPGVRDPFVPSVTWIVLTLKGLADFREIPAGHLGRHAVCDRFQ